MSSEANLNVSAIERLRRRCARVTSSGRQFIPEIDGLRFLAIALVVVYHLHDHLTQRHPALIPWRSDRGWGYDLFQQGHIGVQLFFVISGFILAMPFAKWRLAEGKPVLLKSYYWRRITRLEPPYIINLLVFFTLLAAVRGDAIVSLVGPLLASMTYTHNVVYGEMSRINFVAWSLEIEAQFYLIAPALGLLYRISRPLVRRIVVVGTGLLALGIEAILRNSYGATVPTTLLGSLIFFAIGWMLADVTVSNDQRASNAVRHLWDLTSLVCLAIVITWSHEIPTVFTAGLLGTVVLATLRGRWGRRVFTIPWVVAIGGMCYTIYLYHFLLITGMSGVFRGITITESYGLNMVIQAALILPVTLAICIILYLLFEKPFMAISRRDQQIPSNLSTGGNGRVVMP